MTNYFLKDLYLEKKICIVSFITTGFCTLSHVYFLAQQISGAMLFLSILLFDHTFFSLVYRRKTIKKYNIIYCRRIRACFSIVLSIVSFNIKSVKTLSQKKKLLITNEIANGVYFKAVFVVFLFVFII